MTNYLFFPRIKYTNVHPLLKSCSSTSSNLELNMVMIFKETEMCLFLKSYENIHTSKILYDTLAMRININNTTISEKTSVIKGLDR